MQAMLLIFTLFYANHAFSQNNEFQQNNVSNQNFDDQGQEFQNQSFQNQNLFEDQELQNQGFQNQGFRNQGFQNQGFQNQDVLNQTQGALQQQTSQEDFQEGLDPISTSENNLSPANSLDQESEDGLESALDDETAPVEETIGIPLIQKIEAPNLFAGAPPIPGSLGDLAAEEAPEEYIVEIGDTLFEICDQLLDEPGYWPKLWSLNPYISNPHFIFPKMRLRFFSGDSTSPPFLRVITEDEVLPVDGEQITESDLMREDVSRLLTRLERVDRTPVLTPNEMKPFPEIDEAFVSEGGVFFSRQITVTVPAYIFEDEVEELATVVAGSTGSLLIGRGEDIILELEDDEAELEGTLTVLRYSEKVYNPLSDDFVGYRYEFIGHINNIEVDSEDEDVLIANSVLSRMGIMAGDLVVPFISVRKKVPMKATGEAVDGLTVLGFDHPDTSIGGRGNFVYLDIDEEASVEAGQTIALYRNTRDTAGLFVRSELPNYYKPVGDAYIVEVNDTAAIGYITNDTFEIRSGNVSSEPSEE
ncbi:MAG: LysM peptidoglycan-binding domain-containing protein [Pseudobacteriovorax sp.]|nr:LysM peptidoglycan-binding domain-containing protein [Pseudobacteriovorax sp.]